MNKFILLAGALAVFATSALAAEDPVSARQSLMKANGDAAAIAGGILKGEMDYNPVIGRSVISTMSAVSQTYGGYFPEGSSGGADSIASPKIWEDAAGFQAEIDKFISATNAAMKISGKDGPADADAFKAAMGPIFGSCKSCHEGYRIKK
jgi:cytochrome c556